MINAFDNEWNYYILFCGLFGSNPTDCVKYWDKYEGCFQKLIQADGQENGPKRLIQAIALYFGVFLDASKHDQKVVDTLMVKIYNNSVLKAETIIGWCKNEIKSDKRCALYHRPSEKVLRPMLEPFIEWFK